MEITKPLTTDDIIKANNRFDQIHGNPYEYAQSRIKSGWNESRIAIRGKLTDRQISKYAKLGRYTEQYKEALRALASRRTVRVSSV